MRATRRAGSAIIEFALIAPVFFLLLMGTMESGIIFIGDFVLQNAVNDAARQIRTGVVASDKVTQENFRALVCNEISGMLKCDAQHLQIDVKAFTNFSGAGFSNPIKPDGTLDPTLNAWEPGKECSVVLVRAFYSWAVVTPLLTPFLVNLPGNNHLITATEAFRNEPYTAGAEC